MSIRTRARERTRALTAQHGSYTTYHLAVSSMMAHISFCLQHKSRSSTRAAKRSLRATRTRILFALASILSAAPRFFPSSLPSRSQRYSSPSIAKTLLFLGSTASGDSLVSYRRTVSKRVRVACD